MTTHRYATALAWEGSTAQGYRQYVRDHEGWVEQVRDSLPLSADPAFLGDAARLNPEQLLVMAASSCQLLSFLSVAARRRIDVLSYTDEAEGFMDDAAAPAKISRVVLRPRIVVLPGLDPEAVHAAAETAHKHCYIANSLHSDVELDVRVAHE